MAYILRYNSGNNIKEVTNSSSNTDSVIIATFALGPKDVGQIRLGNNLTSWCKNLKINGKSKSIADKFWLTNDTFYTIEYTLKDASKISTEAFNDCRQLDTMTLPASIQKIEASAFKGCNIQIQLSNPIPPTITKDAFAKFNGTVQVPEAYASAYTEAWGSVVTIETY